MGEELALGLPLSRNTQPLLSHQDTHTCTRAHTLLKVVCDFSQPKQNNA